MLSDEQLEKFWCLFKNLIEVTDFPSPNLGELEEAYTARVVLPWLQNWVNGLRVSSLHVRGDGGSNPEPLFWKSISLYPDLTVRSFEHKYLALEIKFIRNEDPGGSLTKAVGQSFMYHYAGFRHSVGLVFDIRTHGVLPMKVDQMFEIGQEVRVCFFN